MSSFLDGGPVDEDARLDRDGAKRVMRRLVRMLRPYRRQIVLASIVLVLQTACLLAGPALVKYGVDNGLTANDSSALNQAAVFYLVVAIFGLVFGRSVIWLVSRTGERFLRELRERVFRHLIGLSMGFFETEKTGRLVSRMTSDIDALQELISQGLVMFVSQSQFSKRFELLYKI